MVCVFFIACRGAPSLAKVRGSFSKVLYIRSVKCGVWVFLGGGFLVEGECVCFLEIMARLVQS